ncbi:MAG: DEAD/DEAH box helicase, partial [Candidatus Omnitrophica bacterium]|nr:DEAD/DEAH box helicase [Candidatus Omnitrophota bacterium]
KTERVIGDVAAELLQLQAARSSLTGYGFSRDAKWQNEFEKQFPYKETPDQLVSSIQVKKDMEAAKPMDRLLCGDVGYGKTEVALRAAFKAVMDYKQVVILVPTTILAQQHYNTFTQRLSDYPVNVQMLSRFKTQSEQKVIIKGMSEGEVDIVIGTHRLLSDDIVLKNLGLVIIDEEQRFGVGHKEKLKHLRLMVDVLTLTATPIPRTLYGSLVGVKDMSIITTAPKDRVAVKTCVTYFRDELVQKAIARELDRGGQVYFVHNRVESIGGVADNIQKLVPGARIAVGHGQMANNQLEQVMRDFIDYKTDILVCTTIIESGLDIPNVNTIIINRADVFGLSDLYQLKGRVGRFKKQAYAYFLIPEDKVLNQDAQKRLEVIEKFTDLGSGFKIAIEDLEIRGAGNLLGHEQSGYIYAVGFDLYCKMIKNAVESQRRNKEEMEIF